MNIQWVQGLAEDLPAAAPGPYSLVTFGQSFHWTDEQRAAETVYDMLEPGGALALIVHTVTGLPRPPGPGVPPIPLMRSRRWWGNISDRPGAPARAPPQNELTASRMCWPGLALVFRSSSSSRPFPLQLWVGAAALAVAALRRPCCWAAAVHAHDATTPRVPPAAELGRRASAAAGAGKPSLASLLAGTAQVGGDAAPEVPTAEPSRQLGQRDYQVQELTNDRRGDALSRDRSSISAHRRGSARPAATSCLSADAQIGPVWRTRVACRRPAGRGDRLWSGSGEHARQSGGELDDVDRAGGVDLDNRPEPQWAAWLAP
jgi:hypothetical protein